MTGGDEIKEKLGRLSKVMSSAFPQFMGIHQHNKKHILKLGSKAAYVMDAFTSRQIEECVQAEIVSTFQRYS